MIKKLTSVHEDDFDIYFESDIVEKNKPSHSGRTGNKASSSISHTPRWGFYGCRKRLKRLLRLLLLTLLLWLIWRLFSNFNLGPRISAGVKDIFTDPIQHGIINEEQKNQLSGNENIEIISIASGYYEIITKDENIIKNSITTQVITIPEPITRTELCKETDQYWHLGQRGLDYNGFVYDYINTNKKKDLIVAILDSGIDRDNNVLYEHIISNRKETSNNKDDDKNGYEDDIYGVNIPAGDGSIDDFNGHGTHIAGIVLQTFPNAQILPIKISKGASDIVEEVDFVKGLRYAIDQGVDIINLSFGSSEDNEVAKILIQEAIDKNIIVIAAAGNESDDVNIYYPASYQGVLSVGSLGRTSLSSFSNIGADNNMPGECIYSNDLNGEQRFMDGTSMSTPQLVGVLGTYFSLGNILSLDENDILSTINKSLAQHNNISILNISKFLGIENQNNEFYKNLGSVNTFLNNMKNKLIELQKDVNDNGINDIINFLNNAGVPNNAQKIEEIYKSLGINTGFGLTFKQQIDDYLHLLGNSLNKDSVKLISNKNNILEGSLGIDSCTDKTSSDKKYCSSNETQYGCDDSTYPNSICGIFSKIIQGGEKLPTTGSESYVTMNDYQDSILFPIYQGNDNIAAKNTKLGEITLSNIPSKLKGQAGAIVYFDVDKYGYLSVTATDKDNNRNNIKTKISSINKESTIASSEDYEKIKNNINNVLAETEILLNEIEKFYKLNPNNYIPLNIAQKQRETIRIEKHENISPSEKNILVSKIIDGDTIDAILNNKTQRIRLIGIDAPESTTLRYGYEECYGDESSNYLNKLLNGKKVNLLYDDSQGKYDKYNRLLAYVIVDEENINETMIEQGYGFEYTYENAYIFQKEFKAAQQQAMKNGIGLRNNKTCNGERRKK